MEMIKQKKPKRSFLERMFRLISNLMILVILALFTVRFTAAPLKMKGHSMEPAIMQDSSVFINRTWYKLFSPERYEVAAFSNKDGEVQIKRIIGLPGETIRISEGVIYIDGEQLSGASEYIKGLMSPGMAGKEITLGENEYFVLGDEAAYSEDSRSPGIGNITADMITGKAWFFFSSILSFGLL